MVLHRGTRRATRPVRASAAVWVRRTNLDSQSLLLFRATARGNITKQRESIAATWRVIIFLQTVLRMYCDHRQKGKKQEVASPQLGQDTLQTHIYLFWRRGIRICHELTWPLLLCACALCSARTDDSYATIHHVLLHVWHKCCIACRPGHWL